LELWLTAVRPVLSNKAYAEATTLVEEFRKPGGQGRKLQARLAMLASDPTVENWQEDMYNRLHYLAMRTPLVPNQNFAGTHFNTNLHSAAERAAIIASACHEFNRQLEGGLIHHQIDRGRKLERNQYHWFFNSTRVPRKGEDVMMKYPGNDYLVAFRRGWVFKVELNVPFVVLKTQFQSIIDSRCAPESRLGVLTTDDRDVWADSRELLQNVSEANARWLRIVEAASFVVYLDDAQPETARQRGHQFLHTGFNRWSDKTIQFAVCDNGWSSTMGEHSMIDGYAVRRLNTFVQDAIDKHPASGTANGCLENVPALDSFAFETTTELEERIVVADAELRERSSLHEMTAFELQHIGTDFCRQYKIPAISAVQMTIQLASRKYFGSNPLAHETVGLAHFKKGRVECSHIVWPAVKQFCDAAFDQTTPKETLRELFFEAVKSHANNLMRSTQGHGIDRHLISLEWSVRDGEPMPEFFSSTVYKESRPKMLMTDCLEGGVLEAHYLPAFPGGVWVHFEPESDRTRFSVWAKVGEADRFEQCIKEGAVMAREILEI
jgi:hypothetical protein